MIKENLRKDLVVKQIQAPWPEPNEIDQEYCDRDCEDCSDGAEPFENALQHVIGFVCRMQQQCAVDSTLFEVCDQMSQVLFNAQTKSVLKRRSDVPRNARNDGVIVDSFDCKPRL